MTYSSPSTTTRADSEAVAEVVHKAIEQVSQPITARQLRARLTGPYKLTEEKLEALLEEMAAKGRVHRFAASGRSTQARYLTRSVEQYARETMLRYLAQRPHTRADLLKRLKSPLAGVDQQQQKQMLSQMVRDEHVYELPAYIGGSSKRYSAQPPDPREYIEDALKKIGKKLGISQAEVLKSTRAMSATSQTDQPQNDLSEKLLARMVQVKLAAAQGGLVPLNELWRSLQNEGWDKAGFDRTVLEMAENYRVALQRHNFPASLSEAERAELVADGLGNYYIGIALR